MKAVKVDFSKRDEKDRLDIPAGLSLKHGDRIIAYDEDMEVQAYVVQARGGRRFLQLNWHSVVYSTWKANPPADVQRELAQYPMSTKQSWESSF